MMRQSIKMLTASLHKHKDEKDDDDALLEDVTRWDGLSPQRRSAHERRQSFLQHYHQQGKLFSSLSTLRRSESTSSAFTFCASDDDDENVTARESSFEQDLQTLLRQSMAASSKESSASSSSRSREASSSSCILKHKTHAASLEFSTAASGRHLLGVDASTPEDGVMVQFSTVTVYYHDTILGDNPSVSSGAPLALGAATLSLPAETYNLDVYEAECKTTTPSPTSTQLKLSAGLRQRRLLQAGVRTVDLLRRIEQCDHLRYQQQESIQRAAAYTRQQNKKQRQAAKKQNKTQPSPTDAWGNRRRRLFARLFARSSAA